MTSSRPAESAHAASRSGATAAVSFNATKLQPPASAHDGVPRAQLLAALAQEEPRLVLLLAPAGYGKTTLMAQWMQRLQDAGGHASWLTLDDTDNDPVRLMHYLHEALRAWMAHALGTATEPEADADWMSALDRIGPNAPPLTLFLDECEKLTDLAALRIAKSLAGRLPRSVRLVMSSRDKPPIGLERFRLRGELVELTAASLRFGEEETQRFLAQRFAKPMAPWLVDQVQRITDGWPAALQLTALATRSPHELERYARDFSRGLANLTDYLAEDVLQAQTPELREFLLDVCRLPRLCAAVCDAATGRFDSKALLQYLERHGLFTSALDAQHLWYRLHPLFAEFLQGQQARCVPRERVVAIHRGAARWFARQGAAMEAVDLWLLAGDTEAALQQMNACAPELVTQAQFGTIARWIERVDSGALVAAGAQLPLAAAWACGFAGDVAAAERWLGELQPWLQKEPPPPGLRDEMVGVQAVLLALRGDTPAALRLGLAHWPHVGEGRDFAAGALANVISYCLVQEGDFERAAQFSAQARRLNEKVGSALGLGYAVAIAGSIHAMQGELDRALEVCAEVDTLASRRLQQPWFDPTHVKLASIGLIAAILYEQDRLDEAEDLLQRLPLAIHQPSIDMQLLDQVVRARLRMAQGDAADALALLEQGMAAANGLTAPLVRRVLGAEQMRIALVSGDKAQALAWAETLATLTDGSSVQPRLLYVDELFGHGIDSARALLARGDARTALAQLDALIAQADAGHRRWRLLKLRLLRALALQALNERASAQAELLRALCLGERLRARRSFTDEGPQLAALLADLPRTVLAAAPDAPAVERYARELRGDIAMPPDAGVQPLLSERERAIVQLLETGLGNEQIAAQLFLSVHTVKWYVRRILEKLQARNRNEAVFIARRLQLL